MEKYEEKLYLEYLLKNSGEKIEDTIPYSAGLYAATGQLPAGLFSPSVRLVGVQPLSWLYPPQQ